MVLVCGVMVDLIVLGVIISVLWLIFIIIGVVFNKEIILRVEIQVREGVIILLFLLIFNVISVICILVVVELIVMVCWFFVNW